MKYLSRFLIILIIIIISITYRYWFSSSQFLLGDIGLNDWRIHQQKFKFFLWSDDGLGRSLFSEAWNHFYFAIPITIGKIIGLSAQEIRQYLFLLPALFFGFLLGIISYRKLLKFSVFWPFSILILLTNTYYLNINNGGQIAIFIAGIIGVFIVTRFISLFDQYKRYSFTQISQQALFLAMQIAVDLRISYITIITLLLYILFRIIIADKKNFKRILVDYGIWGYCLPLSLAALAHSYWILPIIFFHINPTTTISNIYTSSDVLKYFSFTDFSHALSLLHPNWPENIFGKTYFLQPEFLILPILAFGSLLWIKDQRSKANNSLSSNISRSSVFVHNILFFNILALIGTFLAKGVNAPLGFIYLWLFEHLPGFVMFRDSSKWYFMIIFSYALLIPYTLEKFSLKISDIFLKAKSVNIIHAGIVICFCFYWVFTIRDIIYEKYTFAYKSLVISEEYRKLERMLSGDDRFYRTMWIPVIQRFGYVSDLHPAISSQIVTESDSTFEIFEWLNRNQSQDQLKRWSVRYIIVPDDILGEIFQDDRKYDNRKYLALIDDLRKITWLEEVPGWSNIKIFENKTYFDKFWVENISGYDEKIIKYHKINPTKYKIIFDNEKDTNIAFNQNYDSPWMANIGTHTIESKPTTDGLNSFFITESKTGNLYIYYQPQDLVILGYIISSFI